MFQKFYEFNVSSIFYKMRENFPSMGVSVRMYQIACVSRRMRRLGRSAVESDIRHKKNVFQHHENPIHLNIRTN